MTGLPGYRLLGTLQSTGSNVLLDAVREADGLSVILKIPAPTAPGPREYARYRQEFEILKRLRSVGGIARPYGLEQVHGRPVLLLEKVQGRPLSELVGQPFDVARFLELAISVTSTLAEIHGHGVIHKDIKPSNIIVEHSGAARFIDFGAATLQRLEHLEAAPTHLIEGTLAYMSPEQTGRMNRALDYRTDFYSLGVTFYELLTGERPFHGRDALEWCHAHMAQSPSPPHERVPNLPPALSAIVLKLLAKVAEERYQSAEGLRADLERCREGLRRNAREAFPLGEQDTPSRFHPPQRLYGRASHVTLLLQGFERVARGRQPELILLRGYSGLGKSSVVNELHKPVVQRRGFFLRGKFDPLQRDIPYATLAQAIRGLVQQLLAGTDEELARWRERMHEAWSGEGQLLVDLVPQLELVTGKQPAAQELPHSEAQHRWSRVFRKFLGVFATAEHPLVVSLDDLQWADPASLRLLQHLLTHPEAPPVLWLGTYRENEVSLSHPLMLLLEELRNAGTVLTDLQLEPLSLEQTRQLVADTLPGAGTAVVVPLSEAVHEKTGGNPFFLIQLLVTLNQDGLLVRTPGGTWRWDAEGVRARGYSDNVVDFLVGKLRQLPPRAQHLLRLASCVGSAFSLPMLGTLSGLEDVGAVEHGLTPALQEGLLMRSGPEHYRFLHDRIQQAAEALSSEAERKQTHLRIGRLLLESLSPEEVREKIFDVVSQLNAGAELISDPAEHQHLARLNAEAGRKAMASVAYRPAITYLAAAFAHLPADPWETAGELAFELQLQRARCEFLSRNMAEARRLVEALRARARTRANIVAASCLKTELHLLTGEVQDALTSMLECLALLGVPMSPHPSREEVMSAQEEVWALIGDRPIASLIDLPPMTDPDVKVVMSAHAMLFAPAYFTDNHLLIINLCRMVSLSLRHGFTEAAVTGFSWLGVLSGSFFKRYREGLALGLLARELVERYDLSARRAAVLFSLQFISYWTQPLPAAQELALEGFHHALQLGEFPVASFCCASIVLNRVCMGHPLDDVYQESVTRADFLRKSGAVDPQSLLILYQRYVQQLRGHSRSFDTLSGDGFEEREFESGLAPGRMITLRCTYWIIKLQSRFMCGAYAEALEAAGKAAELLWGMNGSIQLLNFHLYRALSLAARFEHQPPEEQRQSLEALQRHHQQLAGWADNCPETFRAPERLVAAEQARITNRPEEAIDAFEEAIQAARAGHFTQQVGLANELAANFWRARRAPAIAQALAREALAAYLQWGARGKVQHLEASWPGLASSVPLAAPPSTTTDSKQLDALTVVKAQQAISGEIVLERLVSTLMQVAIENAGAQRGVLLLPHDDTLSVVAASSASAGGPAGPAGEPRTEELPWSLIAYVRRTHEHVLINDASRPHPFSSDEHLSRSPVRSVLCLPLLRKDTLCGVLYLENNLATNAFTPARLSLLGHLASQASISMENARLYADVQRARADLHRANDQLEQRVEERTRELKELQSRLVSTAREVGMTEVASNVLHTVGNVLTSAVVNLEVTRDLLDTSRLARLKQATDLLLEQGAGLADFLSRDPRGSHLPTYLSALADELLRERALLQEGVGVMGDHIEQIRATVRVQQSYARATLLREECDLAQLVQDALRIQLAALQGLGVSITQELPVLPKIWVDKHKVLQILINLLTNAKHALEQVRKGPRSLSVRLIARGKVARIQVVDNGMGFGPEVREQLFSYGFTTRKDGHGFGLHSSALAAQLLGGRLTLESEGPGRGATATLEIPLEEGPLLTAADRD